MKAILLSVYRCLVEFNKVRVAAALARWGKHKAAVTVITTKSSSTTDK